MVKQFKKLKQSRLERDKCFRFEDRGWRQNKTGVKSSPPRLASSARLHQTRCRPGITSEFKSPADAKTDKTVFPFPNENATSGFFP